MLPRLEEAVCVDDELPHPGISDGVDHHARQLRSPFNWSSD